MSLPYGKIPVDILQEVIFKNIGAKRKELKLGPAAGLDGAVIDIGTSSLITSMDPITGAIERIGYLAVNVNANDIATFGVNPAFIVSCILLPENSTKEIIQKISSQMNKAAKKLGIAIVGGHCEVTPKLSNPIVVCCAMGITSKGQYVTAANARPNDVVILTKSAGLEGTAILAFDKENVLKNHLSPGSLNAAKKLYNQISVVKDALTAYTVGGVNAMHDPTEGGVFGGLWEMAHASHVGFKIYEEKISLEPVTSKICNFFGINPLQLISSGSLLIAAKQSVAQKIVENLLKNKINATIIGKFTEEKKYILRKNGDDHILSQPVSDHLWKVLRDF